MISHFHFGGLGEVVHNEVVTSPDTHTNLSDLGFAVLGGTRHMVLSLGTNTVWLQGQVRLEGAFLETADDTQIFTYPLHQGSLLVCFHLLAKFSYNNYKLSI